MLRHTKLAKVGMTGCSILFLVIAGHDFLQAQTIPQHFHGVFFCESEKPGYAEMALTPAGKQMNLNSAIQLKTSSKGYFDFGSVPVGNYTLSVKESCGKTWKAVHHLELEADSALFEQLGCGSKERPIDIRFEYGNIKLNIGPCW